MTVKSSESILRNWIRLVIDTRNRVLGLKLKLLTKENVKYFDPDLLMSFARG